MTLFGQQFERGLLFSPITSIIGGIMGGNAATKAANVQETAANTAGADVTAATNTVNPTILAAGTAAGTGVTNAATAAGTGATDAATAGAGNVTAAAGESAAGVNGAVGTANALLDPYAQSGAAANSTLAAGVAPGGQFDSTPTLSQLQMDPGYAFRLQQGSTALDRSAAARGGVTSGGNIKAQTDYAQGAASQEYQNAFSRYETSTQNNYNNVSGVANRGLTAGTTMGTNDLYGATYAGNAANTAAMYNSALNQGAAQYSGTAGITGATYAGNALQNSTNLAGANTIGTAKTAADYLTQGANAKAAGIKSAANAYGGALNAAGTFGSNILAGLG